MDHLADAPTETMAEHAKIVGFATGLMCQSASYRRYPLASINVWIEPAIFHGQIRIFFDHRGLPVGYLTWAFLSLEVVEQIQSEPNHLLHLSEWNEGGDPYVIDFLTQPGFVRPIARAIAQTMFPNATELKAFRRDPDGAVNGIRRFGRRNSLVQTGGGAERNE